MSYAFIDSRGRLLSFPHFNGPLYKLVTLTDVQTAKPDARRSVVYENPFAFSIFGKHHVRRYSSLLLGSACGVYTAIFGLVPHAIEGAIQARAGSRISAASSILRSNAHSFGRAMDLIYEGIPAPSPKSHLSQVRSTAVASATLPIVLYTLESTGLYSDKDPAMTTATVILLPFGIPVLGWALKRFLENSPPLLVRRNMPQFIGLSALALFDAGCTMWMTSRPDEQQ
ncbi:hypothetical protein DFH07DRAFT_955139 [Mycena maculata]|uniref:Uncharacterized protein n=1 Tax=Mycena maculata TaxID=230809 RepID=A0AAD7NLL1_9AGAR|nr:hypothetical protein DFH07DRAFT_955139 [Mycena maculata]